MNARDHFTDPAETTEHEICLLNLCKRHNRHVVNYFSQKSNKRRRTWYYPRIGQGAVLDFNLTLRKVRPHFSVCELPDKKLLTRIIAWSHQISGL